VWHKFRKLGHEIRLVGGAQLRRAPMIVLLTLLAAGLDLIGVALIAPFLGLIVGDDRLLRWLPAGFVGLLGADPLRSLGLALVLLFAIKALATFVLHGAITRMSESIKADLMTRLLAAYQRRSYRWYLDQNSSDLVNRVVWYTTSFSSGFVGAGLRLASDAVVFVALSVLILIADWRAFVLLALVLGAAFAGVHALVRVRAERLTRAQAGLHSEVIHAVNQAMGGLREIRMIGCEEYFLDRMRRAAEAMVDTQARLTVLHLLPRQGIEFAVVLFLVALVFVTRASAESGGTLVPLLGVIGASAVRLMPASTALLANFNSLRMNRFVVSVLANDLEVDEPESARPAAGGSIGNDDPLGRFRSIRAEGVRFAYDAMARPVLDDFELRIEAGEIVGLMGPSGAGKSTIADLLLGLLTPQAGGILVNDQPLRTVRRAWQSKVAYIPQLPYLLDDTLRRNVALGVRDEDIDDRRVIAALRDASLGTFLDSLPEGLDTRLGERGVRLSGGQRQRVSIARALYHDREFLVLDEATSALDRATESEILETIANLRGRKTMVIIAHRESTLVSCTRRMVLVPGERSAVLAEREVMAP
jgi:ABC-type multidrug transport system fused ATPase/permease subunit